MTALASANGTATKCPHCKGVMEAVNPRGLAPFKRCTSCGRDDRVAVAGSANGGGATKCAVDGCPGEIVGNRCACCEKRAKWLEANEPKRSCEICGGRITGRGMRKYCGACGPMVNRVNVAKKKEPR